MQFKFGSDRYWNSLRKVPMRSNWILAKTDFRMLLEKLRWDAIEIWLRQSLEWSQKKSDEMQLNFGYDTVWKCLRKSKKSDEKQLNFGADKIWNCLRRNPMRCNWILAMTHLWNVLEKIKNPTRNNWILALKDFGFVFE